MAALDWNEIARVAVPPSIPPSTASAAIFDDVQELVWIATQDGRIASHHGPDLRKYTSVRAHINEGRIHQLLSHERGILSISNHSIHLISRRGPALWHIPMPQTTFLRCMCFTNGTSHLLVASTQPGFLVVDIEKGVVVSQHTARVPYKLLRKGRQICAATEHGEVDILDPLDYSVRTTFKAHSHIITDMDVKGDYLVTCGQSTRHIGPPMVDYLAKVYDLARNIQLSPIPFSVGAAHVRLHPKLQTTSIVLSQTGQIQVLDLMDPLNVALRQANVQFIQSIEVSTSGDALLINDSSGIVYLWGAQPGVRFNNMSKEIEFASPPDQTTIPQVDWQDSPLNAVGIPYYTERLFSAWPSHMVFEVGAPPVQPDPNLAHYLQPMELGHVAQNVFRKGRSNSYINSLLQLYRFVPLLRNVALQHAATSCVDGSCLLCEFGFLFDMMEKAAGQNCQATNLLRTFGLSRAAASSNLFETSATAAGVPLGNIIQHVNRFFLKHMADDYAKMNQSRDGIDEILSTNFFEVICCNVCRSESTKHSSTYLHELSYTVTDMRDHRPRMHRFSQILKQSIERETKNRAWCNRCHRYQQLAIRKTIRQLPYVLMINTAIVTPATRQIWETPHFLPQEIGIMLGDKVNIYEGSDLNLHVRNKAPNLLVYELVGYVADVDTDDRQQPHLVSVINTEVSNKKTNQGQKTFPNWHLFNDFLVDRVDPREATHFNKSWKLPSIICYQAKTAHGKIDDTWRSAVDTQLLHLPYSMNNVPASQKCHMLSSAESPNAGMHIALDTEFVELEKAEIDVKADGTRETIRPAKNGLARVSVLRGEGAAEGLTFIDDYITISETIVDYKTQYSGIRPGDLDPISSTHNLVPLKVAYKKLWILLNLGCVFVGHGLASDFRKANIHIPKSQTIDTQYLYFSPSKNRRLSLRYLAWAVFGEYIQEETMDEAQNVDGHDSIEDAHMALRLWRKYQEYEQKGEAEHMVEEIFRKGQRFGWKPPLRSGERLPFAEGGPSSNFASGRNTPEPGMAGPPGTPGTGPRISASTLSPYRSGMGGSSDAGSRLAESPLR
ncbi:PAB-dependent poly(A)-specific ribonuclease subunit pan2 [Cyphellophora attinorum]|uniref:PAB-dependent poly(A)-specific ribonuclease subunit pan2 n=1 Tax=Cyphellophora attinorum TaxID=1664694 RepID=A0A0N1H290_9EURO|nr:PAB-dependent poly(A)-specific ribonuclease subunit pan2 [Phialophora attinorum]KPI34320.1 PAB-dependent poly(A)-specific ribonuclease subunit pan2 [Phialophora attinorum]